MNKTKRFDSGRFTACAFGWCALVSSCADYLHRQLPFWAVLASSIAVGAWLAYERPS